MTSDPSLAAYRNPRIVDHYDHTTLQPWEQFLFAKHVPPNARILDLGTGAGRTAPRLASGSSLYVGLDYSDEMIARCRKNFPHLTFVVGDASDLSRFADGSFDCVVFSFNGLGCLPTDALRERCLREVARVVEAGGVFLFSLHNPHCLAFRPTLRGVPLHKQVWRTMYAAAKTAQMLPARLRLKTLLDGAGYIHDPTGQGGETLFNASPKVVRRELGKAGFDVLETVSGTHPDAVPTSLVPWYGYAAKRRAR